MRYNDTDELKK